MEENTSSPVLTSSKSNKFLVIILATGLVLSLALSAILFVLLTQKTSVSEQQVDTSQSTSGEFLSTVNTGDLKNIQNYVDDREIEVFKEGEDNYSRISLLDLLSSGSITFEIATENAKMGFLNQHSNVPSYDEILVSQDGKIFLLIKSVDEKISTIYVYVDDVNSEAEAPQETEEDGSEVEEIPEGLLKLHSTISSFTIEEGQDGTMGFYYESKNLVGANCSFNLKKGDSLLESKAFTINGNNLLIMYVNVKEGKYVGELSCTYQGESYNDSVSVEGTVVPGSVCDKKDFGMSAVSFTFAEVKSKIIGDWKGCTANPWGKPYRVSINFRSDGKYTSKNIEMVENLGTIRRGSALYYGTDTDSVYKTFELKNQLTNGEVEGDIYIYFNGNSAFLDKIRAVKLSEDGNTLYFEIIHSGTYGPIKFLLSR